MSGKKNKALERELMDDLLEDATDPTEQNSNKAQNPNEKDTSLDGEPSLHLEKTADFSDGFEKAAKKGAKETAKDSAAPALTNATIPIATSSKSATAKPGDDATVRLSPTHIEGSVAEPDRSVAQAVNDDVRASVGRFGAYRNTTSPTGAALAQSENLRIAQSRILELEQEVSRLRVENEELAAAGETFRRKSDELSSRVEDLENRYQNALSSHSEEKALLLENKETLRRDLENVKAKNEDLELRISTNIQKIRVRERELENRLELVKMEGQALIRSKDEMILDLKRQIDQLGLELNNYRTKSQELNRMILDKQDILRRTVKALRLALTMLEGDEESATPIKKAK